MKRYCIVDGCEGPQRAKGMCMRHYFREWKGPPRGRRRGLGDSNVNRLEHTEAKLHDAETSYANACGVAARLFWREKVAECRTVLDYVKATSAKTKQHTLVCLMCGKRYGGKKPKRAIAICSAACRQKYADMRKAEQGMEEKYAHV